MWSTKLLSSKNIALKCLEIPPCYPVYITVIWNNQINLKVCYMSVMLKGLAYTNECLSWGTTIDTNPGIQGKFVEQWVRIVWNQNDSDGVWWRHNMETKRLLYYWTLVQVQSIEQTVESSVIWIAITLLWCHSEWSIRVIQIPKRVIRGVKILLIFIIIIAYH